MVLCGEALQAYEEQHTSRAVLTASTARSLLVIAGCGTPHQPGDGPCIRVLAQLLGRLTAASVNNVLPCPTAVLYTPPEEATLLI